MKLELLNRVVNIQDATPMFTGKRIESVVQIPDIAPSIIDIIGNKEETLTMQGQSFLPVIQGEQEKIRDYAHIGIYDSEHRCIRNEEWSYIHRPEGMTNELYNIKEDPEEKVNVLDKYPDKAKELSSHILKNFLLYGPKGASYMMNRDLEGCPPRFKPIIAKA